MRTETLQSPIHESVPSAEIFFTEDELLNASAEAIESGVVQLTEYKPAPGIYPDIAPRISLEQDEVDTTDFPDSDIKFGAYYKAPQELTFKDPSKVLAKTELEVKNDTIHAVANNNQWHFNEPSLEKDLKEGRVSQLFEIATEGHESIMVVNFTDSELTDDQLQSIRKITDKANQLTAGTVFDATNALCILPSERFNSGVVGSARAISGVITLNESLINGELERDMQEEGRPIKFSQYGIDALESTLTHEYWHLIELKDTETEAYAAATGWSSEYKNVVNDYGDVESFTYHQLRRIPHIISIGQDGKLVDVKSSDHFTQEELEQAKPVTKYAYTNNREDSAEAFVPYVHTESDNHEALDPVRRNAITGILERVSMAQDQSPRPTEMQKLPLEAMKTIKPATYTVDEPKYNIQGNSTGPLHDSSDPKEWYSTYNRQTVTDDYGNEVVALGRQPRQEY